MEIADASLNAVYGYFNNTTWVELVLVFICLMALVAVNFTVTTFFRTIKRPVAQAHGFGILASVLLLLSFVGIGSHWFSQVEALQTASLAPALKTSYSASVDDDSRIRLLDAIYLKDMRASRERVR